MSTLIDFYGTRLSSLEDIDHYEPLHWGEDISFTLHPFGGDIDTLLSRDNYKVFYDCLDSGSSASQTNINVCHSEPREEMHVPDDMTKKTYSYSRLSHMTYEQLQHRKRALKRYKEKRERFRNGSYKKKRILYPSRKAFADTRKRVGGRFVKNED